MKFVWKLTKKLLILALGYAGLINGVVWAENIFLFLMWLLGIGQVLILAGEESRANLEAQGPSLPEWIHWTSALACTGLLAGTGHFVVATIYLFSTAGVIGVLYPDKKPA